MKRDYFLTDAFLDNAEIEASGMIEQLPYEDEEYDEEQAKVNRLAAHTLALIKDARKYRALNAALLAALAALKEAKP